MAGLELSGVVKRYNEVEAVSGVDLTVTSGEFMTLLGPSGSGKTTILRLVSGFTDLSSGRIMLAGRDVSNLTPAQRGIGMVFQNYALFPHLSVEDNIAYGLKMRKWSRGARRARIAEMLELVGLEGMGRRLPREISGGQQQRVAVARALAFSPDLMLMDEPLGALDRELRFRMAGELRRIHAELGTTVVYVTHDREEALTLSDRIAIMQEGLVEAVDTPMDLFNHPSSAFVATFFGGHNLLAAERCELDATGETAKVAALGHQFMVKTAPEHSNEHPTFVSVPVQAIGLEPLGETSIGVEMTVIDALYMGDIMRVMCVLPGADDSTRPLQADLIQGDIASLRPGISRMFYVNPARCTAVQMSASGRKANS